MIGGVQLDLRHARFGGLAATIHAYALMGGIEIIVPEDIEVDVAGLMGGFDHRASGRR
jgi:predicted membrane protein